MQKAKTITGAVALIVLYGGGALSSQSTLAALVTTNLGNPDAGVGFSFGPTSVAANAFTTDAQGGVLQSATLRLTANSLTNTTQFSLSLYDNNVDRPGSVFATFDNMPVGLPFPSTQELTFFTNTPLAPNTTYWLGLTVTEPTFGFWSKVTGPSTGPWTIGADSFSFDGGASFTDPGSSSFGAFSLDATVATAIPEPSSIALWSLLSLTVTYWRRRRKT